MRQQWQFRSPHSTPSLLTAVFLAYIVLALAITFPWALHFTTHTPDSGGEPSIYLWNLWHFRQGLHAGSPFETDLLLAPFGANLVFHVYTIGRDLLAYPLLPSLGLVTTHNLLVLLSFGLSGLGVFLLVYRLTKSSGASFVAGLIYTFSPYRFAHLGQYNLSTMEWLPLYCFFTLRFLKEGGKGHWLAATALGLWISLNAYYYAVFAALWTILAFITLALSSRWRSTLKRTATLGVATVVAHIPLFLLLRWAAGQAAWVGLPPGEEGLRILNRFSADLAAYLLPNPHHPLWNEWMRQISEPFTGEWVVTVGIIPLLLTLLVNGQLRHRSREVKVWILSFWIFLMLSLGPSLTWYGQQLGVSMPFSLLTDIPGLREARILSRYSVMVALSAAVLGGVGLAWLAEKVKGQLSRPNAVHVVAAVLVLFELFPAPLYLADRATIPAIYHHMARDRQPGTVLDLPFGLNDSFRGIGAWNPQAMYYQTISGRPIVGAHISRTPSRVFEAYLDMPIVGQLARIERGAEYTAGEVEVARQAVDDVIETLDLRYVVVPEWHKKSAAHAFLLEVLGDCLEMVEDDGLKRGYLVERPCNNE